MHLRQFLAGAFQPPGVLGGLRALPLFRSRQSLLRLRKFGLQALAFSLGLGHGGVGVPAGVVELRGDSQGECGERDGGERERESVSRSSCA